MRALNGAIGVVRSYINRADRLTLVCVWIVLAVMIPFGFYVASQKKVDERLRKGGEAVTYSAVYQGCQRGNASRAGAREAILLLDRSKSTFDRGYLDQAIIKLAPYDCNQEAMKAVLLFRQASK